jgi:hypothetical protein
VMKASRSSEKKTKIRMNTAVRRKVVVLRS